MRRGSRRREPNSRLVTAYHAEDAEDAKEDAHDTSNDTEEEATDDDEDAGDDNPACIQEEEEKFGEDRLGRLRTCLWDLLEYPETSKVDDLLSDHAMILLIILFQQT